MNDLKGVVRELTSGSNGILVAIGVVLLSLVGNSLFLLFTIQLGSTWKGAALVLAFSVVCLLLIVIVLRGLSRRGPGARLPRTTKIPTKRKGLIVLVSNVETASAGIRYHEPTLERCWLVYTAERKAMAEALRADFPKCLPLTESHEVHIVYEPADCFRVVDHIYSRELPFGWTDNDVIADVTGMTVGASLGMALACIPRRRALQYVPPNFTHDKLAVDQHLRGWMAGQPIEFDLNWWVALFAQSIALEPSATSPADHK